ncbi:MAG: FAD-dependent oxidoreductase [Rhodobacteraceae bacterium]|nr:FAD-dependent oxidoreductase [Paracoccaceae bacterium]
MTQAPTIEVIEPPEIFDLGCETLIIGAGTCGLISALSAHEAGQRVLAIEADPVPSGSTALSAGLIPAAGTSFQTEVGIEDSAQIFAADIQRKAKGKNEQQIVDFMAQQSAEVIDWLAMRHGFKFSVVTDFDYPGHTNRRMHGLPTRSGRELIDALRAACERVEIDIICNRRAFALHQKGGTICGASLRGPEGTTETVACRKLILACNGFGGNRALVEQLTPDIKDAIWFGHGGNQGEAILWGTALNADLRHLGAYQGHGNVAHPHGILITWATITEGGIQVNRDGLRFWDETQGYSEAARTVLAQPGGVAYTIFDARIATVARQFEDFKNAEANGAVLMADTVEELSDLLHIPAVPLRETVEHLPLGQTDAFGRCFGTKPLCSPFMGVKVTGALFHTQGGLRTDMQARVLDRSGTPIPGLFAGGGAACGVSGSGDAGYLSGNGLLSAAVLGRLAGRAS